MPRFFRRAVTSAAVIALGLGGALVVASPAAAATTPVTLPGDANVAGTLRFAINEANAEAGQSAITIAPGLAIVLTGALPALDEGVTITGGAAVTIARTGSFDIFTIAPNAGKDAQAYSFVDLELTGNGVQTGRAILANTAVAFDSLDTDGVIFNDFLATVGSGGAVLIDQAENGPITFSGGSFTSNESQISGGGVSVTNAASITFDDSITINGNESAIGGGIAANDIDGAVTFVEHYFEYNEATNGDGGGVALHDVGSVSFSGPVSSSAQENDATGNGGFAAIDDVLGAVTVTDGYYYNNDATNGGAFWIDDVANFTITNSLLESNEVTEDGGGAFVTGATTPVFVDARFRSNEAEGRGGGAAIVGTEGNAIATATITGGEFYNNTAGRGAGVAFEVTDLAIVQQGTVFDDNHATQAGGGGILSSGTVQSLQFNGITLQDNDAIDGVGAGIYILGAYETTLTDVDMFDNDAELGGGLYVNIFNTSVLVQDSTFRGNSAQDGSGGAINIQSVDQGNSFTLLRSTLQANSADGENPVGGALAVGSNDGTVKVDSSTFIDNLVTSDFGDGTAIGATQFNNFGGVYDIVNSTFEETVAETEAFAIWFPGNVGTVLVHSNTITGIGGIGFGQNSETVTVLNTIIDVLGTHDSIFIDGEDSVPATAQYSLFSDAYDPNYVASASTNSYEIADMKLGALANNGGPTDTRLPAADSPAVNKGSAAADALLPATDQRGPGFARVLGAALDIGAVEVPAPAHPNTGSTGLPIWVPIVGGIVLLAGIGFVVFSVINRRKSGAAAGVTDAGEPGPGTGGDALFPEASTAPPTAQPPAENDPR